MFSSLGRWPYPEMWARTQRQIAAKLRPPSPCGTIASRRRREHSAEDAPRLQIAGASPILRIRSLCSQRLMAGRLDYVAKRTRNSCGPSAPKRLRPITASILLLRRRQCKKKRRFREPGPDGTWWKWHCGLQLRKQASESRPFIHRDAPFSAVAAQMHT